MTIPDKYDGDSDYFHNLEKDIADFINGGIEQPDTEDKFAELALRLFEYQYKANEPYRKYCIMRGVKPGDIDDWKLIPAVPTNAFKEIPLCTFPPEQAAKIFLSSGTTNPKKRSKVFLNESGLKMLDLSLKKTVETFFYRDPSEKLHALLLSPSPDRLPHDAAVLHVPKKIIENHYLGEPRFLLTTVGLNINYIEKSFRQSEVDEEPVLILGTTYDYVHLYDYCLRNDLVFRLPEGSRSLDTGGYKGRSREPSKTEYLGLANQIIGIEPHLLINCYMMTELQALLPDNVLYNYIRGHEEPRHKINPPWTRTVVVDPDTLEPIPKGKHGLLRHYCLSNIVTVQALQTDDTGYEIGTGFEVIGRAKGVESREYSIAVDELLSAQTAQV
ncbi:hypothetical protein JXM67_14805 [candidate division WOR-3 bacterium]|nr:hypothetical protein [candidate division WOR-3 bacterium]